MMYYTYLANLNTLSTVSTATVKASDKGDASAIGGSPVAGSMANTVNVDDGMYTWFMVLVTNCNTKCYALILYVHMYVRCECRV